LIPALKELEIQDKSMKNKDKYFRRLLKVLLEFRKRIGYFRCGTLKNVLGEEVVFEIRN
jgi:hypothetical protein